MGMARELIIATRMRSDYASALMCAPIGHDKVVPWRYVYTDTDCAASQAGNQNCHTAPFFLSFRSRPPPPSIRRFLALRPVGKRTHGFSHTFAIASDWPNNSGYAVNRSFSLSQGLPPLPPSSFSSFPSADPMQPLDGRE